MFDTHLPRSLLLFSQTDKREPQDASAAAETFPSQNELPKNWLRAHPWLKALELDIFTGLTGFYGIFTGFYCVEANIYVSIQ